MDEFWKHHLEVVDRMLKQQREALTKPRTTADYVNERHQQILADGQSLERQIRQEQEKKEQERRDKEHAIEVQERILKTLKSIQRREHRQEKGSQQKKSVRPDRCEKRDRLIYEGRDLKPKEFAAYAERNNIPGLSEPWPGWRGAVRDPVQSRRVVNLRNRVRRKYQPKRHAK